MRRVRYSKTFQSQIQDLLAQGHAKFGGRVIAEKGDKVYDTIELHIAEFPATGTRDTRLRLFTYPISQTPFVVIYDFGDDDVRVHFIVHVRSDRTRIVPGDVEW